MMKTPRKLTMFALPLLAPLALVTGCGQNHSTDAQALENTTNETMMGEKMEAPVSSDSAMNHAPRLPENVAYSPDPMPYDVSADAQADVAAAFARAEDNGKLVLLKLGGNWCADCRMLGGILDIPEVHDYVVENFEYVKIDVGRYDKNMDIPARFGLTELNGVPTLMIITADGTLLNTTTTGDFNNARDRRPQEILDYLYHWREEA